MNDIKNNINLNKCKKTTTKLKLRMLLILLLLNLLPVSVIYFQHQNMESFSCLLVPGAPMVLQFPVSTWAILDTLLCRI